MSFKIRLVFSVLKSTRDNGRLVCTALTLRNDIYDFGRIGTFIAHLDSTARIIDVSLAPCLVLCRQPHG